MFVAEAAVAKCFPVDLLLHVILLLLLLVGDELPAVAFLNQFLVVGVGLEEVPQPLLLAAEVAKGCLLVLVLLLPAVVLFVQLRVALLRQVQGLRAPEFQQL
jgi:hypothetical protein